MVTRLIRSVSRLVEVVDRIADRLFLCFILRVSHAGLLMLNIVTLSARRYSITAQVPVLHPVIFLSSTAGSNVASFEIFPLVLEHVCGDVAARPCIGRLEALANTSHLWIDHTGDVVVPICRHGDENLVKIREELCDLCHGCSWSWRGILRQTRRSGLQEVCRVRVCWSFAGVSGE